MWRTIPRQTERLIEAIIFASRWILAPFYLGLALALFVLLIKFMFELVHIAETAFTATESQVILGLLALVDLALTGSLVIIVIFSGYENFVSKFEAGDQDRPDWMTKVDFGGLKHKLMTSIVAISAIQLLRAFMNIEQYDNTKLAWLAGIHVVFLVSMLVVALADRLSDDGDEPEHARSAKTSR